MTIQNVSQSPSSGPAGSPWTCPFCSLLCDSFSLVPGSPPVLAGSACPVAGRALAHFGASPSAVEPLVGGEPTDYAAALNAAAAILARSEQPLFAGMATDVAGARAMYRLANTCGAILDHARGESLMHSTRALQDRGVFYATLGEIRNRADLVVCLGTDAVDHYPEFFRRIAPPEDFVGARRVVFLGASAARALATLEDCTVEEIPFAGDVFDTVAVLAARLAGRNVPAEPALERLAAHMQAARYTAVIWESGALPAHGALVAETIQRIVNTLNRTTRAAAFCLGGSDGGYTANQVLTWLSGLPIRTGVHPQGLEHEPQRYATARLVSERAVDAMVWVSSFTPELMPPVTDLPLVVLGHPGMRVEVGRTRDTVFIPVATPGIGSPGHLFRADGGIVLPLTPIYEDALPTVASVAADLVARVAPRTEVAEETR